MSAARLSALIMLLAALAVAATACGRRPGTLQTPYSAAVEARQEAEENDEEPLPPEPDAPREDRPFILDGLL